MNRAENREPLQTGIGQRMPGGADQSGKRIQNETQHADGIPMEEDTAGVEQEVSGRTTNGSMPQYTGHEQKYESNSKNARTCRDTDNSRITDPLKGKPEQPPWEEFDPLQSQSGFQDHHNYHYYQYPHSNHDQYGQTGNPSNTNYYDRHAEHVQQMKQMQRSAEASKQMLYGVYGNVVSILEEYEARTQTTKAERSNIALPDQSRKTVEDVQSIVQTQLLLFETQQRACPKEVSASVNKELRQKTVHWAAVRAEHKMKISDTDKYICQLYEVLVKGKTKHDILNEPRQPVSSETIRENFQHILQGKYDASQIDQQFKADDEKKATRPETRRSAQDDALDLGANRMSETMPSLFEDLASDLKEFKAEGPHTIR